MKLSDGERAFVNGAMYGCLVGIFIIGILTRMEAPDTSETRLFLMFWHRYLAAFGLAAVAVFLSHLARK